MTDVSLELSELPVGTQIRDQEHGVFEVSEIQGKRIWMESYAHCVDCAELVAETDFPDDLHYGELIHNEAKERFTSWIVTLVPPDTNPDLLDRINKANDANPDHG